MNAAKKTGFETWAIIMSPVFGALLAISASADEVYLKSGGKLTGKVTEEGEKVKVVKPGNIIVTLAKDQIDRIVYSKDEPDPKKTEEPKKPDETKKADSAPFALTGPGIKEWSPLPRQVSFPLRLDTLDVLSTKTYALLRGDGEEILIRTADL